MSRHPRFEYEHPANHEENYYPDEHEGFVADYSDSDCVPDGARRNLRTVPAPAHLTELYGKNSTIIPVKVVPYKKTISKRQSEQFVRESYCDGNLNASPRYSDIRETSRNFYPISTASQHDVNNNNYGTMGFRSAYRNFDRFEQFDCQNCQATKSISSKRLPITVRTPKYYKKSQTAGVFKRPSALCLPVAVQPDPAVIRRPKKTVLAENLFGMRETQAINPITDASQSGPVGKQGEEFPHRVDSQGDLKSAMMPPFEEFVGQAENSNFRTKKENKTDIAKITKFFKPRVPATVRARQEKAKAKSSNSNKKTNFEKSDNAIRKSGPEADQFSLEKLLNQLKKCELTSDKGATKRDAGDIEIDRARNKNEKENGREKSDVTDDEKFDVRSFNYQDITQNLFRSQCDFKENSESVASIQDITKKLTSTIARPQPQHNPIKPLDDNCALELHKSKSYIVNLIDRALSKELGTIPGDRNRKEFEAMNPKKAIETVNRHLGKSDRDISVEITSALTDSLISNVTSREMDEDQRQEKRSKEKLCCCNSNTGEPIYIKQLKQLRWGHLKHIQREVKRLEDLERFLDSCSITTIPEL